mmetsp:Transcript_96584/g.207188  ORF Transcript_96584/g.207188 Transcript_96584/m.207188 type:complete len:337 (-) Transcript_96584:362-1372(-)
MGGCKAASLHLGHERLLCDAAALRSEQLLYGPIVELPLPNQGLSQRGQLLTRVRCGLSCLADGHVQSKPRQRPPHSSQSDTASGAQEHRDAAGCGCTDPRSLRLGKPHHLRSHLHAPPGITHCHLQAAIWRAGRPRGPLHQVSGHAEREQHLRLRGLPRHKRQGQELRRLTLATRGCSACKHMASARGARLPTEEQGVLSVGHRLGDLQGAQAKLGSSRAADGAMELQRCRSRLLGAELDQDVLRTQRGCLDLTQQCHPAGAKSRQRHGCPGEWGLELQLRAKLAGAQVHEAERTTGQGKGSARVARGAASRPKIGWQRRPMHNFGLLAPLCGREA